ncbi:hypothetical protein BC7_00049 [Bacillus phage BC-7]|nr:hypothetical protein BC7_00049 [Bacillus phage BC-7]
MKEYTQKKQSEKEVFEVITGGDINYIRLYDWESYPEGCLYLFPHEAEEVIRKLQNAVDYHKRNSFNRGEKSL